MRCGRVFAYLAMAGPGLVAANAGYDAAGIATYSSAGSQLVYRTVFLMVLAHRAGAGPPRWRWPIALVL